MRISIYEQLLSVYRAKDALPLAKEALEVTRRVHPTGYDHHNIAFALDLVSFAYRSDNQPNEALPPGTGMDTAAREGGGGGAHVNPRMCHCLRDCRVCVCVCRHELANPLAP